MFVAFKHFIMGGGLEGRNFPSTLPKDKKIAKNSAVKQYKNRPRE